MKNVPKQTLFVILCFAILGNTACTSMQTVHASPDALAEKKIRVGDKVTLQYVQGYAEQIRLTDIGEEELTGIADDGRTVAASYDDVISLDHKEVEVMKSAGAAVGVVALGAVLIGAVAVGAMVGVAGAM